MRGSDETFSIREEGEETKTEVAFFLEVEGVDLIGFQ